MRFVDSGVKQGSAIDRGTCRLLCSAVATTDPAPRSAAQTLGPAHTRRRTVVRLSRPQADRPRPLQLIAIAIVAGALGVGVAWLNARSMPATQAERAAPRARPRPETPHTVPAQAKSPLPQTPQPAQQIAQPRAAAVSPPPTAALVAATANTTPTTKPAALVRGFVAYLRCDGLERRGRRFPCPRDPALEAAVWRDLAALPGCTHVALGQGPFEARLGFLGAGAPTVDLRGTAETALHLDAVRQCVADRLTRNRTRLGSPRLVVAFHAELR